MNVNAACDCGWKICGLLWKQVRKLGHIDLKSIGRLRKRIQ